MGEDGRREGELGQGSQRRDEMERGQRDTEKGGGRRDGRKGGAEDAGRKRRCKCRGKMSKKIEKKEGENRKDEGDEQRLGSLEELK